ncbi:MAG: dethiobiotin synthase [Rikenellaceae bacterium]
MKDVYFVSGIDTDAGKSYVTGFLAKCALDKGIHATTMKFIQTGGVSENGYSIDIETHREIMDIDYTEEDKLGITAPVIFSYPASPHLAAEIDNKEIDYKAIDDSIEYLSSKYELVFIEGAGGLHVPLDANRTTIDYIQEKKLKVILATGGKLGSINHTILSLEALKARNIEVSTVVYNRYFGKDDQIIDNDTFKYIKNYMQKNFPNTILIEKPL